MKELSIEEKAKRYDEAVEKLRSLHDNYDTVSMLIDIKEELESIFPELKMSEDERIRKHLIGVVELYYGNTDEQEKKDCLAWLEKQGEKNKWKPSKDEMDALYGLSYITNKMDDKKDEAITKLYQDLKREFFDGASYENMFLSSPVDAPIKDEKQGEQNTDEYIEVKGLSEIEAEADELIKEMSGEKHNLTDFERTLADICIGWIGEEPGWVEYIKDNADVLLKIAAKMFNSVQDVPFEQKPAPKHKVGDTIYYNSFGKLKSMIVANVVTDSTDNPMYEDKKGNTVFEKDLVERKPTAWSEEDEEALLRLTSFIEDWDKIAKGKKSIQECTLWSSDEHLAERLLNFLNSLRPQSQWKPSDESFNNTSCTHLSKEEAESKVWKQ